jgi:hypothetical protein
MSKFNDLENLSLYTNGIFSDIGSVTSATALNAEISGIFDEDTESMFGRFDGNGSSAEGRRITFLVQTSLADGIHHRDTISIKGRDYLITGIDLVEDGLLTELTLKQT